MLVKRFFYPLISVKLCNLRIWVSHHFATSGDHPQ